MVTLNDGNVMPQIGLGTFLSASDFELEEVIKVAILEKGYRHLDCAWIYGNEDVVGRALQYCFQKGIRRHDIFITTKDVSELESRLRGRGSEDDETFELRMATAKSELEEWNHYTYYIISGTPEDDFSVLSSIINSERIKVSRISS